MTRAETIALFERARRLADGTETLTPEERRVFPSLCAREMAKAEARRQPTPQLPLDQAA